MRHNWTEWVPLIMLITVIVTFLFILPNLPFIPHQGYWYCWDKGDPKPHHLGYKVSGDHLCTNRELGK